MQAFAPSVPEGDFPETMQADGSFCLRVSPESGFAPSALEFRVSSRALVEFLSFYGGEGEKSRGRAKTRQRSAGEQSEFPLSCLNDAFMLDCI